jgi:hypothetical protein
MLLKQPSDLPLSCERRSQVSTHSALPAPLVGCSGCSTAHSISPALIAGEAVIHAIAEARQPTTVRA